MKFEQGDRLILEPPAVYNKMLRRELGLSPNGFPMYRLVWGWSRLSWMGGYEEFPTDVVDDHGELVWRVAYMPTQRVPKYWPDLNLWHLETWNAPATVGSPEHWRKGTSVFTPWGERIEKLGPYPDRGYYESVFMFRAVPGVPLPFELFELAIASIKQAAGTVDAYKHIKKIRAALSEEQKRRASFDADLDKLWDDKIRRPFSGPTVAVPGSYNPARMRPRAAKSLLEVA
jgi:hypothetical protein